jgi:hypothetical protein
VIGKVLDEKIAAETGKTAVAGTKPLTHNGYMVPIARALVKRTISACSSI